MEIFGSLSNVGVRVEREQDSGSERDEVSEAEGDSLEGFNGVIAALGKTVGQVNVKCIQDVRFPVDEHSAAGIEFGETQSVAGVDP